MTEVSLSRPTPDDWAAWREVRLRALQTDPWAYGSTYEENLGFDEARWRDRLADGRAVMAHVDGVAAGIGAWFEEDDGWALVVSMWTDPAYRGLGVGRQILDELVSHATASGKRVRIDVVVGNPAQRLYERAGFVDTGRRSKLRPHRTELTVHLELPATPG